MATSEIAKRAGTAKAHTTTAKAQRTTSLIADIIKMPEGAARCRTAPIQSQPDGAALYEVYLT